MARAISDEELQLRKRARRRLVGAVILVTVIVVALPMLLDSEPKSETQDINIRIPATDAGPFAPKAPPAPPAPEKAATAAKPESKGVASAPRAAPKPSAAPAPATKGEKPAAAAAPKPAAAKAPPKAAPEGDGKEFVVQVIALSDADKAKQIQQKISAVGIKSYTEVVKTEKGDVTRVRVGPFASREAAEKARGQLKGIGLDGKVIPR